MFSSAFKLENFLQNQTTASSCVEKVNPESCDFPIRLRVGPLVDSSNCPAAEDHPTLDHRNIICS